VVLAIDVKILPGQTTDHSPRIYGGSCLLSEYLIRPVKPNYKWEHYTFTINSSTPALRINLNEHPIFIKWEANIN
jgi:hypothetical protein